MSQKKIAALAETAGFELPSVYNASRLLWDNLPQRGQNLAVLSDSGSWTYQDLAYEASRVGNCLLESGCLVGDRVLLFMDDEPAYPAAIMGSMRAGLVPVLINTLSPPDLIQFYLEDSSATAAVVSSDFANLFQASTSKNSKCKTVLVSDPSNQPWSKFSTELLEQLTQRQDMAFWMYSSGSTGRPKGVVHKHEDAAYTAATYAKDILKIGEDDICFSVPKIFFAYGFGNSITFPFSVGAASVLLSGRPEPVGIFEHIRRHKPTLFFGLPTLYTALSHHEAADEADFSSVRLCLSAAEVLSEDIASAWRGRFGHSIIEGLGSTEMLHIYLSNRQDGQKVGSAGKAVPGYAIKLVDTEGIEAPTGEEGVMHVCGLSGAEYYWGRPDKTAETMLDGWLNTDDRFTCDEEGFHFFKGRANDLIKVSGQWVYPLEIEHALNEHPAVQESCVLAVELPDKRLTLQAWIALTADQQPTDDLKKELQSFCKKALLPHKYPRSIDFLDRLPKTGTDKIDRQALKRRGPS